LSFRVIICTLCDIVTNQSAAHYILRRLAVFLASIDEFA